MSGYIMDLRQEKIEIEMLPMDAGKAKAGKGYPRGCKTSGRRWQGDS